jgi:hypothetical protein
MRRSLCRFRSMLVAQGPRTVSSTRRHFSAPGERTALRPPQAGIAPQKGRTMKSRKSGHIARLALSALLVSAQAWSVTTPICSGNPANALVSIGGSATCWTGPSYAQGLSYATGRLTVTSGAGRKVEAFAYGNLAAYGGTARAQTHGYDFYGNGTCSVSDFTLGDSWAENSTSYCNNTAFIRVVACYGGTMNEACSIY